MKELIVNKKYNNKKIDEFLYGNFPALTKGVLYKALRKKDIQINGKRINSIQNVFENDVVKIYILDNFLELKLEIVYEDDNILVINKPSGIEVTGENSLTAFVQKQICKTAMPCHRLDRNTYGLILFAKNNKSLNILFDKFKNKEIEKHYIAYCYGVPSKKQDRLESYLFKDNKKSLVYISDTFKKGYQKIITNYIVLKVNKDNKTCILDVNIETGKTHQIRAHLAHIGLPIIGDGKYGINDINKKFGFKTQQLCSYKLIFNFKNNNGILDYLNKKQIVLNYSKFFM